MHTHARRADLPALTSLRALAALTVFAFHLGRWGIVSTGPLGYGYAGVTFFFVLSGFVLTWSHNPDRSRRDFYVGRFARVWPSHGVIWVLLLLVPLATRPFTAGQAALNVLLVQAWVPDAAFHLNGVTWSLSCEASFYLLFPFALDALTRLRLTAAWLVVAGLLSLQGVLTLWVASWPDQGAWATVVFTNPLLRLPEFLVGVVAARHVVEGRRVGWGWVTAPAAIVGFLGWHDRPDADIWAVPVAALVVMTAARSDLAGAGLRVLRNRWLVVAGQVSFAFYLVHELVITNLRDALGVGAPAAVVMLVVSAALAVVLHYGVERPAQRQVMRLAAGNHGDGGNPPARSRFLYQRP